MHALPDKQATALARTARLDVPRCPGDLSQLTLTELWYWHQQGQQSYYNGESLARPARREGATWLAIKVALAHRLLSQCDFCVHLCLVDRVKGQTGYCQLTQRPVVSGYYVHHGEESLINPTFAVFLGGCTMHCNYCHNWRDTFTVDETVPFVSPEQMADAIQQVSQQQLCRTLSFIGGTPEPHLHYILDVASLLAHQVSLPLVFNSNATLSSHGLDLMAGIVDVYLPDFKHGNDQCALQLTKIPNYVATVVHNLQGYQRQGADILVRHLVLPGHLECCTYPVMKRLVTSFPGIKVNLMTHYRPAYKVTGDSLLGRRLNTQEKATVAKWSQELGLNCVS